MEGDSLKLNFEIALEKIDTLSEHNQALLDKIQEQGPEIRSMLSRGDE